ncbi:AAA family ATPase [Nocardioides deserti]|uniref:Helix-turn-helix domain-containing protein n=1 Tax=Nocardioides deserti TaxID=1588644 RepID=A0ABR6U5A1_9ACTN|nr:LuxR family transcriptional regulator [Nocardioides deserti]MBC2959485.1 helix-turn-helix domain-containing protein [Nocardioides deserti]GGO73665.1 LuxR family transcriptional regulator [Nocardioides deserti]
MAQLDDDPCLLGRERELADVDVFLSRAEADGAALLLTGDPGVGKSSLLDAAARRAAAAGVRVVRTGGVEYETDVSFAGLHQLVDRLADELVQLPAPSREALQVALGLDSGPAPERLTVLQASLALLRRAADEKPLLVVIDDMHWLDRATASVIGFVGRRVGGSRIGLLGATRPGAGGFFERTGWPELGVRPLDDDDAMELLAHQFAHLPTRVLREVAHEAQGNPLALLEFAAAAGHPRADPRAASGSTAVTVREVRSLYATRIGRLPAATRRLLLLAALEGSGSLAALAESSASAGLSGLDPAERDHLVLVDERSGEIRFRHPMIKSVVVELSTHDDRREAHQRLAEIFPDQPERRGHHAAEAAEAPDEAVAAIVEEGAQRTLRRGDVVGAVTRLLRAAELSPQRGARSRRMAHAAFIGAFAAGELKSSSQLLREAKRRDPTLGETLEAAVATAYMLLNSDGDATVAHRFLTAAIDTALAEPDHDRDALSRGLYTLVVMCHYAGRVDYWEDYDDLVARMGTSAPADALLLTETFAAPLTASPSMLAALDRQIEQLDDTLDVERIIRTAIASFYTDRLAGCRHALDRVARDGRDSGAAASALMALSMMTFDDLAAGRWHAAERTAADAGALADTLGYRLYDSSRTYATALIAARRGDLEVCTAESEAMLAWAVPRQLGRLEDFANHALGEAALGAGAFEEAYAHAAAIGRPGSLHTHDPQALWSAWDLVDAALHTGRSDEARAHAEALHAADPGRLSARFAMVAAAARAMVAPDDTTADLFDDALGIPGIEAWPFDLARARLAYGERLRRLRRTRDARVQLEAARDGFDRLGARLWSRRASAELRATGATRRAAAASGVGGVDSLTPQELEVAQLAAGGLKNREIATRLYVSPRTVSAHLYRIFPKLGITSRAALRDALGDTSSANTR